MPNRWFHAHAERRFLLSLNFIVDTLVYAVLGFVLTRKSPIGRWRRVLLPTTTIVATLVSLLSALLIVGLLLM